MIENGIDAVAGKFRSGNDTPITRAAITAEEWEGIVAERDRLAAGWDGASEAHDVTSESLNKALEDRDEARAEVERLELESDKLREAVSQKLIDTTMLTGIIPANGSMNVGLEGGACRLFAEAFAKQFADIGAENYVEASFTSSAILPGEAFVVRLQKVSGKTPHMLKLDAEAERDKLRARVAELGWQPITSAPKDGTRIWALYPNNSGREVISWGNLYYTEGHGWVDHYGSDASHPDGDSPSHWVPVPNPNDIAVQTCPGELPTGEPCICRDSCARYREDDPGLCLRETNDVDCGYFEGNCDDNLDQRNSPDNVFTREGVRYE